MVPHLDTVATIRSTEHELALQQVGRRPRLVAPRAAFLPVASLLALATGVALLVFASLIVPPDVPPAAAAPSAEAVAAVHAFYAAANDILRAGNPAALDHLLAPDVVEHADRPGLPGRDGLVQYLARLRVAHPTLRFEVEAVLANGDLVSARVIARAPGSNPLTDGPAGQDGSWTGVDVFRIINGQVTERWSGSDAPSLVQPLARVPLDRWPPGSSITAAAHLTIAPGAALSEAALPGPGLIVVEAGALGFRGSGGAHIFRDSSGPASPPPVEVILPGIEQVLSPGDVVAFPSGTAALSLRNEGSEPVVALAVAWFPSAIGRDVRRRPRQHETGMASAAPTGAGALAAAMRPLVDGGRALAPPGITVTPLGSLESLGASQVPPGRVVVTLDRVILAPGTGLPPRATKGPVLLAVEAGVVGLVPVRETARLRSRSGRVTMVSAGSETFLAGGEAAFWDAGAVALLRGGLDTAGTAVLVSIGADALDHPTAP